jgi:hypothetical protein
MTTETFTGRHSSQMYARNADYSWSITKLQLREEKAHGQKIGVHLLEPRAILVDICDQRD